MAFHGFINYPEITLLWCMPVTGATCLPVNAGKHYRQNGMFLKGVGLDLLKTLRLVGLFRSLFGNRYLMPPIISIMVGSIR